MREIRSYVVKVRHVTVRSPGLPDHFCRARPTPRHQQTECRGFDLQYYLAASYSLASISTVRYRSTCGPPARRSAHTAAYPPPTPPIPPLIPPRDVPIPLLGFEYSKPPLETDVTEGTDGGGCLENSGFGGP